VTGQGTIRFHAKPREVQPNPPYPKDGWFLIFTDGGGHVNGQLHARSPAAAEGPNNTSFRGGIATCGEWFYLEIKTKAKSDFIEVLVNGRPCLSGSGEHPGGVLSLWNDGRRDSRIAFRNIEIKDLTPAPEVPGWIRLFNGKNLDGWVPVYDKKKYATTPWDIVEPVLVLKGGKDQPTGYLRTEKQYREFHLRLDYKHTSFAPQQTVNNSHVYWGMQGPDDPSMAGMILTPATAYPKRADLGGGLELNASIPQQDGKLLLDGVVFWGKKGINKDVPWTVVHGGETAADKWNRAEIITKSGELEFRLNGVSKIIKGYQPVQGHLALFSSEQGLHLRNIEIKELTPAYKDDKERLQGHWVAESVDNGRELPKEVCDKFTITTTGNKMTMRTPLPDGWEAIFHLNETATPKKIDIIGADRKAQFGIYRFEGERLILCIGEDDEKDRPTEFSPKGGNRRMVVVLKRELPLSPAAPPLAVAPFNSAKAKEHQDAWAKHLGVPVEVENSIGMKLRLIPPGEFMMGSLPEEVSAAIEDAVAEGIRREFVDRTEYSSRPQHKVRLSQPFCMGTCEVTVGQFRAFVKETGHRTTVQEQPNVNNDWQAPGWNVNDNQPVTHVSWDDARAFCRWLNQREGRTYELPSEAQWEFACRAGSQGWWTFGNDISLLKDYAWYGMAQGSAPQNVGQKRANGFGLHDMHGNIQEWCLDWHEGTFYRESPSLDPVCSDKEKKSAIGRVVRGGWWRRPPTALRSAARSYGPLDYFHYGFRVAIVGDLKAKTPPATSPPAVASLPDEVAAAALLRQTQANLLEAEVLDVRFDGVWNSKGGRKVNGSLSLSAKERTLKARMTVEGTAPYVKSDNGDGVPEKARRGLEAISRAGVFVPCFLLENFADDVKERDPWFTDPWQMNASTPTFGNKEKVGGRQAQVIEFTLRSKNGLLTIKNRVWIDTDRKLPIRWETTSKRGNKIISVTEEFEKIELAKQPVPPLAVAPFDAAKAKEHQEAWAKHLGVPVQIENSIGMKLRLIPPAKFMMGASESESNAGPNEKPQHEVTLTKPCYVGAHEVTVGQFKAFVKAVNYKTDAEKGGRTRHPPAGGAYRLTNSSPPMMTLDANTNWQNTGFTQTHNHPVVCVTWHDARAFCAWLSNKEGRTYTLLSEAQWEYCCRAGTQTAFSFGNDPLLLDRHGWYRDNSKMRTHPVGEKEANAWGLFDMHGNAEEWTADAIGGYQKGPRQDPLGAVSASRYSQSFRGGSWFSLPVSCRSACCQVGGTPYPGAYSGFRVAVIGDLKAKMPAAKPADLQIRPAKVSAAEWKRALAGYSGVAIGGNGDGLAAVLANGSHCRSAAVDRYRDVSLAHAGLRT